MESVLRLLIIMWFIVFSGLVLDKVVESQFYRTNDARILAVQEERTARGNAMATLLNNHRDMDTHPGQAWAADVGFFDFDLSFSSDAIYFYENK